MENKIRQPHLCGDEQCTGCMACVNSCNQKALQIVQNKEGFYRPQLDESKCIGCGLCERNCPVLNKIESKLSVELKVYAAWHKDEEIRMSSSSGGAFTALAEYVLVQGGVVFGAAYGENMQILHAGVESMDELKRLRMSKYAQSKVGDAFRTVKEVLNNGRIVMFVGTPCQVAGLRAFLHKDYDNLLAVDIICHGVPSILFFQTYLKWVESKYGKVENINFRDKRKGWYDALRVIKVGNCERVLKGTDDNYWVAFNNNNNLQHCCYGCSFQSFPRVSDLTIADFWGVGKNIAFGHKEEIEKGVSLIVVNNPLKQHFIKDAAERMYIEQRSLEEAKVGNNTALTESRCPAARATIYQDLQTMDYDTFRKKYLGTTKKQDLVKLFRERLPYGIIKWVRLRSQK